MMTAQSIEDVIKGAPEPAPEPKPEKAQEPEPAQEAKGEPEPKPEPEKAPEPVKESAPPADDDAPTVPRKALEDERRKRQEYEAKLREIEQAQKRKPAPDPVVDPKGFASHVQRDTQMQLLNERMNMSEQLVRSAHGNEAVDAATRAFIEEARKDTALHARMLRQQNPYQFVMDWHKREQTLAEVGDLDAYKKKLREEILAEAKGNPAILGDDFLASVQPRPKAPTSLSQHPSAGGLAGWSGPPPIEDIFKP